MRNDLSVHGMQGSIRVRQGASATRVEAGEPMHSLSNPTNGVSDVNVFVLMAADGPIIGTHKFGGVANKGSLPFSTGTVVANEISLARPVPYVGVLRGKAETKANVDTESELLGFIQDNTHIDYNSTGGTGGSELYTIKDALGTPATTAGLEIVDGNTALGLIDCIVYAAAYDPVLV